MSTACKQSNDWWFPIHLLPRVLPVWKDVLFRHLVGLPDGHHLVREVLVCHVPVPVLVEPVEQVLNVPIQRVNAMTLHYFFEFLDRDVVLVLCRICSIYGLESGGEIEIGTFLDFFLEHLDILLDLQRLVEESPQAPERLIREVLLLLLVIVRHPRLELVGQVPVPGLENIANVREGEQAIAVVVVSLDYQPGLAPG